MKFLIIGSHGMAGHMISQYLSERGHDVNGYARQSFKGITTFIGDVNDREYLKGIIVGGKYDVIVNCVGILNKNADNNPEQAVYLNSYLPHFLAKVTVHLNTWVIHMSTDCVFSGNSGPYFENSYTDGKSFYDRTKAIGELNDNVNLTLRNSIVGPDINEDGMGLLNWFMKQKSEVNGYSKAMWTGITTLELAKIIEKASIVHPVGLINMVPDHNISKYDLINLFNHYLKNDSVQINEDASVVIDKTLIRTNFAFLEKVPSYEQMVKEMAKWIKNHRSLYQHYGI